MLQMIGRRVLFAIPMLFFATALTFLFVSITPGDPAITILGPDQSPEAYQHLRDQLGLSRPLWEQYTDWVGHVLHGDLGQSLFTGQAVTDLLSQRVPVTLSVVLVGTVLSAFVGVGIGLLAALRGDVLSKALENLTLVGLSIPTFWAALILVTFFSVQLGWLPATGYVSTGESVFGWARSLILPVLAISIAPIATIARQTHDSYVDTLNRPFIRVMQANGFLRQSILYRHALRNAAIPIATVLGIAFVHLLSGTVVIESIFALPGLGSATIQGVTQHDLPVIQGIVFYMTLMVLGVNLLIDIAYGWLDPEGAPVVSDVSSSQSFVRRVLRRRSARLAVGWLALVIVACFGAPLLAPYDPAAVSFGDSWAPPSWQHLLGADSLGRDSLSRLMYGGRAALLQTVLGVAVFLAVGLSFGLSAGFGSRWLDWLILRIVDLKYAIPGIIIMLVVLTVFPGNWNAAVIAFGVLGAANLTRVVRSSTLVVREELYIAAARVAGLNAPQIVWRHILPRIATAIIIQASIFSGLLLVVIATLSFLGLDADPYAPSWGGMLNLAAQRIAITQWPLFPPGLVITLTVLSFGTLGDAIREVSSESWSRSMLAVRAKPGARILRGDEPDKNALLSVRGLTVAFPAQGALTEVVQDVSFDVFPGETLGLVGESGCGKSMTALALLGLVPSPGRVVAGSWTFGGQDLGGVDELALQAIRGKKIAYVSQEPMVALDPTFTVGSQLGEAVGRHTGLSGRARRARVLELLATVNLPNPEDVAKRYPHQLSGGMAQRVAIALALAGSPELLIADEPTTALDVTVQAEILDLLYNLQDSAGMAMILVSHDWGVIADLCRRVLVMYAGQVVEYGPLDSILMQPTHPYTRGLLAANPHGAAAGEPLVTIPGSVPPPALWTPVCHFVERCPLAIAECRLAPIPLIKVGDRVSRCIRAHEQFAEFAAVPVIP